MSWRWPSSVGLVAAEAAKVTVAIVAIIVDVFVELVLKLEECKMR